MFYLPSPLHFILLLVFSLNVNCWAELGQETIYLTWQQSPSTTMTIQWITSSRENQSVVAYRPLKGENQWQKETGQVIHFPHAAYYTFHKVELKNLQPNSEYQFKVSPYPEDYRFVTAPTHLEKELRFVVGGDMYHDDISFMIKTNQNAAKTAPLFALIGGDIAYAFKTGSFGLERIDRWIEWIKAWHTHMVTPDGHLIPVMSAIGNHDLNGGFDQTPAQAAVFSTLFPMPGNRIYNVLDFDSFLSIFILDSGHANPIGGKQADWLQTVLRERQQVKHLFAIYHVPAYPSVRDFKNKYSDAIRKYWVPLFEKWGIQVAFENHDHAYKRTRPLRQSQPHPEGILYLGDGGWGIEKPREQKWKPHYIAKYDSVRHFICVTITSTEQHFRCINDQGEIMDEYIQCMNKNKRAVEDPKKEKIEQSTQIEQQKMSRFIVQ
ncbi:MAG: purple acid phosphatase family protein [Parachlamydiaceae bacterium]